MNELAIKNSPARNLALLCASIGFVAAGVFCLYIGQDAIGWVGIVFFGVGVPLAIFRLLDARPKLVINDSGISDRRVWSGTIPWGDIESVFRQEIGRMAYLCLRLKNEDHYVNGLSSMQKKIAEMNRRFGLPPFCVLLSQLGLNADQIEDLVNKYLAARH